MYVMQIQNRSSSSRPRFVCLTDTNVKHMNRQMAWIDRLKDGLSTRRALQSRSSRCREAWKTLRASTARSQTSAVPSPPCASTQALCHRAPEDRQVDRASDSHAPLGVVPRHSSYLQEKRMTHSTKRWYRDLSQSCTMFFTSHFLATVLKCFFCWWVLLW